MMHRQSLYFPNTHKMLLLFTVSLSVFLWVTVQLMSKAGSTNMIQDLTRDTGSRSFAWLPLPSDLQMVF
jgi:hypothetical protein